LYPPVNTNDYEALSEKENLVISVGAIQPNKRFEDIIRATGTIGLDCRLIIVGYYQQGWYYQELQRLIDKTGLRNRVRIIPNADKEQLRNILSKAKIIVHASRFEPFGISVVEGMASGCVPIVNNGPTSGPWSDILDRGEFGLGFGTIKELAENIERVLNDEKVCKYYSLQARKRSRQFDTEIFDQKFTFLTRRLGL
jgi:glycosyltransferase involved in cell wall biosynthesis